MKQKFYPLFHNSHLATIAGNYWRREIDEIRFPPQRVEYKVAPKVTVVAYEHQPQGQAHGQIVLLHGLEGSSNGGYIVSFTQRALMHGFGVHRLNMRSCGGTEHLSNTMYHSGLTSDTLQVLEAIQGRGLGPLFVVGFSLGGNVGLKLAGELGKTDLLTGVCAVSTPIDLACAVRAIDRPGNLIYARRFLNRLKGRIRRKHLTSPDLYSIEHLNKVRSIWQFDDRYTAPLFGFGTADNYYATQSSAGFLDKIAVPTLVVTAQDDPLVPFEMYRREVFHENPALTLVAPKHGGHLGFLSRTRPRFWLDELLVRWISEQAQKTSGLAHLN